MSRLLSGIEPHVISRTAPRVAHTGEQIAHDVLLVVAEAHLLDRHVNHAVLHLHRIRVDGDENLAIYPHGSADPHPTAPQAATDGTTTGSYPVHWTIGARAAFR